MELSSPEAEAIYRVTFLLAWPLYYFAGRGRYALTTGTISAGCLVGAGIPARETQ